MPEQFASQIKVIESARGVRMLGPNNSSLIEEFDSLDTLERLAGVLIHEVNNPLGTALAAIQITSRLSTNATNDVQKWIDYASTSIHCAATAVRRMQILCERPADEVKGYDVCEAISAAVTLTAAQESFIRLRLDDQCLVKGQARFLTLALMRLLDCAIRAGGQGAKISTHAEKQTCMICLKINISTRSTIIWPSRLRRIVQKLIAGHDGQCQFLRSSVAVSARLVLPLMQKKEESA